MNWMDACMVSPYNRSIRVIDNTYKLGLVTIWGNGRSMVYRDGLWLENKDLDLICGYNDWEPEGVVSGLGRAMAMAIQKRGHNEKEKK